MNKITLAQYKHATAELVNIAAMFRGLVQGGSQAIRGTNELTVVTQMAYALSLRKLVSDFISQDIPLDDKSSDVDLLARLDDISQQVRLGSELSAVFAEVRDMLSAEVAMQIANVVINNARYSAANH